MPRPIIATISTSAMAHNLDVVQQRLEKQVGSQRFQQSKTIAIAKANAYGHSIQAAVRGFAAADGIGVIETEKLFQLRELGWDKDLLLLEGFFEEADLEILEATQSITVIHSQEQLDALRLLPEGAGLRVMLKLNTGMNRLGFRPAALADVLPQLEQLRVQRKVAEVTMMMHFADADAPDRASFDYAWNEMRHALVRFTPALKQLAVNSLSVCNSAATLRYADELFLPNYQNIARPGLCLYGASPMGNTEGQGSLDFELRPAMTLKAKIIAIQDVKAGETVGYGSRFKAVEATRIAVVACGYADGYPRWADSSTTVVVNGKETHLAGRVSMDMMTINLNPIPEAQVGDWVTLWGEGGPSIDQVTACAGMGSYETFCNLNQRVNKQII
ncbi:MAG: alanine racemase [Alcaligenaceae bacterium]|nr:alanine racemase [Alcaligenaceae bacterium]